ncbi:heterokaryon incompatibility protein-domain-containing protein [Xylariomycetidae sp. FL0641]|nr:heterokaryon incompatibility protein-domain-containing protein [Xylariomycetidae sp. FL0641]
MLPINNSLQTFGHKASDSLAKAINSSRDGTRAIEAKWSHNRIKRLCTHCSAIDFDRSYRTKKFIWPIDHVIHQRDCCNFCRLIFDVLSTEQNDPLRAPTIREHIQDDLRGLDFPTWVQVKYGWLQKLWKDDILRDADKIWPFGVSRDPPETPESVRDLIKNSEKEFEKVQKTNEAALMMAAGSAVAAQASLNAHLSKTIRSGDLAMVEAAEGLMWTSALYRSGRAQRLPCWVVGTLERGLVKIQICARGRMPRARLGLLRTFNILMQCPDTPEQDWPRARRVDSRIDLDTARDLFAACERAHTTTCVMNFANGPAQSPPGPPVRLIRVKGRYLCRFPVDKLPRYAALSYVWGSPAEIPIHQKLTADKLPSSDQRGQPVVLSDDNLPTTLKAAIQVTKKLGNQIDYLWVDSWCIIQDSQRDLHDQLQQVHTIYKNAQVTLVAADKNQTAISGIIGVTQDLLRDPWEGQIRREIYEGIENRTEIFGQVPISIRQDLSTWESRAWTFQEKILSRRLLVFSQGYMVWHCLGCAQTCANGCTNTCTKSFLAREDMTDEDAGTRQVERLLKPDFLTLNQETEHSFLPLTEDGMYRRSKTFRLYAELVQDYTGRTLSHNRDALRAFTGISNELSEAFGNYPFYLGIPENLMDVALHWYPKNANAFERRIGFPSWCWAGWRGQVKYNPPFSIHTNDHGALVQSIDHEGNERIRPLVYFYKLLANGDVAPVGLLEPLARAKVVPSTWEADALRAPSLPWNTSLTGTFGRLCFETSVATFGLGKSEASKIRIRVDAAGPIGEVPEEHRGIRTSSGTKVGQVTIHSAEHQTSKTVELIILSEAQFFGDEAHLELLGYPLYTVLAIRRIQKRIEKGRSFSIIERIGIGKIDKMAWKTKKERKELFLLQ